MTFVKTLLAAALALAPLQASAYEWGRSLGWVRNWEIYVNAMGGCLAARAGGDPGEMLLLHLPPATGFQLAFVAHEPDETTIPAEIRIGNWSRALNFYVSDGMAWEVADREMLEQIAKGDVAYLEFETYTVRSSLAGTTAALLKMEDCWVELGREIGVPDIKSSREWNALQQDLAVVKAGAATPAPVQPAPMRPAPVMPLPGPGTDTPRDDRPYPTVLSIEPAPLASEGICPLPGFVKSPGSSQPATVSFRNTSPQPLTVYWLDFEGKTMEMMALAPGAERNIDSYTGHRFIAQDMAGKCHGGVMEVAAYGGSFTLD
ncbi:hypothetical protein [Pseudooceanicola nanhaiensis]|uniref:VHL beta domain-containing protein n=1 Tax=Pseudooceanicola nanhaiensis TaxID=375761 RepID=UPI001CD5F431|nr:hypothetical protein [Pseudooceanicola nanhaiensis]MCA0920868.1 hypothetical protein [Pseudooceanicola nanhaiensis]